MDTKNLKPCPFCGSTNLRAPKLIKLDEVNSKVDTIYTHISCMDCGSDGPKIAYVKDVINDWNTRYDVQNEID